MYILSIFTFTLLICVPLRISSKRCWLFATEVTAPIAQKLLYILPVIHGLLGVSDAGTIIETSAAVLRQLYEMDRKRKTREGVTGPGHKDSALLQTTILS